MTTRLAAALVTLHAGGAPIDAAVDSRARDRGRSSSPRSSRRSPARSTGSRRTSSTGHRGRSPSTPRWSARPCRRPQPPIPQLVGPGRDRCRRSSIQIPEEQVPDLAQWADLWTATRARARLLRPAARHLRAAARSSIASGRSVGSAGGRSWSASARSRCSGSLPRALLRPLGGWIAVGGAVVASGEVARAESRSR